MFRLSATIGLAAVLALAPSLAPAQQAAPAPAPGWAQGRPDSMAASPLAPQPPRLTVTPLDRVPVGSLRVPEGFKVEVWAHGAPGARMMAEGPNGTVFVGTRAIGRVYAVTEEGGQRRVRTLLQQLNQPNGLSVRDGNLYVVAVNRVLRFDGIEGKLDSPGQPADLTAAFNLPTEEHHGWKFTAFSPDGRLFMNVGVPCNICEFDRDRHAMIVSFRPDGSDRRVEARVREGEALAQRMNCGVCHLPTHAGRAQIPRLAGQREEYLVQALTQYRDGTRHGSDTNMNAVMYGVSDAQIAALAHYMAQR